jgi:hypothetical protein
MHNLLGLISAPIHWIQSHFDILTQGLFGAYQAIFRLATYTLPRMIGQALTTARGWVNDAEHLAAYGLANLASWASAQFTAVYRYVNTEITLAEGYTVRLVQQAENYAAAGIAADAKYAENLFTTSIGYTDSQVKALEGWVTGEIGAVTTWTGTQITALDHYITAELSTVLTYAQALVVPVELDLARLKAECTDNLCSNLGSLANVLGALAGDLGLAGVIALAGEMAHDPKGTARAVDSVLSPVVDAASSVMRSATGF